MVIIEMVKKLNYQVSPKLLKIVEEPSNKTLHLLISENQDKFIPTILSRTQLVKFPKIEGAVQMKARETNLGYDHDKAIYHIEQNANARLVLLDL